MDNTTLITLIGMFSTMILTFAGFTFSLFYLHNQNRAERIVSDNRWSDLKTETNTRWSDLKTENDNRWTELLLAFKDFKNVVVVRLDKLEEQNK